MLNLTKVKEALEAKSSLMEVIQEKSNLAFKSSLEGFDKLLKCEPSAFNALINACEEEFAGVLAMPELKKGIIHSCLKEPLLSAEMANLWKKEILQDRITFAVDGSQIEPDKNWGLSFGAIQIAWFINYHDSQRASIKDLDFEIILPTSDEYELRQEIAFKRFEKEILILADLIKQVSKLKYSKLPIAFFDGSLTLSFVKDEKRKRDYLSAVNFLLETSQKAHIPVLGYIDTSLAFNLTKSLEKAFAIPSTKSNVSDASLMAYFMKNWGQRSAFFEYIEQKGIGFCYLKNASLKNKPSRIEMPLWVYEENLINEVLSVVLSECLVGNGYPYPIEVADSIAVIQNAEKEKFYEFIQKKMNLSIDKSPKLKSKIIRRKPIIKL